MKLSKLSETLIASEIVKLGGDIREKMRSGEKIYNFTVGDFDPAIFPIPKALEDEIITAYRNHFTNYPAADPAKLRGAGDTTWGPEAATRSTASPRWLVPSGMKRNNPSMPEKPEGLVSVCGVKACGPCVFTRAATSATAS